jgi:hypothetical protein
VTTQVRKFATLSACGAYRYRLGRVWDERLPSVGFVMLNPSTADADVDDPTIRRCMGYARTWRFGAIAVANVCALRSTDPKTLLAHPDPRGPDNDEALRWLARSCSRVVVAWGTFVDRLRGRPHARALAVLREARGPGCEPIMALRVTKGGHPSHPLYLPADLVPVEYGLVLA